MFGLGTWEIALILLVALLVLGPDKLPQVARTIGRGLREMRRASNDLRMNLELDDVPARPRPVTSDPDARPPERGGSPRPDPYADLVPPEAPAAPAAVAEVPSPNQRAAQPAPAQAAEPASPPDGEERG